MPTPSFALTAPTDQKQATNPLGLSRIDHFQMTGSIERLEGLYRRLGFARIASSRAPWGRVVHLRQQRMDILLFEADTTHPAGRYFQVLRPHRRSRRRSLRHRMRRAERSPRDTGLRFRARSRRREPSCPMR